MKIDFENFDFEELISYMKNYECDGVCAPNGLDLAIYDMIGTFGNDKDREKLSGIMLDSGILSKEEGMYIITK